MKMLSLKKKSKLNEEDENQAAILSIDLCCPTLPKARTSMVLAYVVAVTTFLCFPLEVAAQHSAYDQALSKGKDELMNLLEVHPDVVDDYFPAKEARDEYDQYRVAYPPIEDYVISILVSPCGANGTHGRDDLALGYDCCISRFGAGEYAYRPGSRNLFSNGYSNGIPMSSDEPLHNIDLVDEFGNLLEYKYSRRADDIISIDEFCTGLREPHSACIEDRFAASVNKVRPPCWDHNETVDATLDCYTTNGKRQKHCMQVSYSQNPSSVASAIICPGLL